MGDFIEECIARMRYLQTVEDKELAHIEADEQLLQAIEYLAPQLGQRLADECRALDRWYA